MGTEKQDNELPAGEAPTDTLDSPLVGETEIQDAPSREAELAAALAAAETKVAELKDQLLRALADGENTRRRTQRDSEERMKFATQDFAKDLLPVADNLRRAIEAIPKEALANDEALRNFATGVEMTERLLLGAFERHKMTRLEPVGEKFDSHRHQAVFEVPDSGQPAGTVVQLLEAGYLLHDRLLRPAMVGVAKPEPAGNGAVANPAPGNGAGDGSP